MTEKGKYRVCGALAGTVNGLFGGGGGIPARVFAALVGKALRQDGACDLRGCHLPVLPCVGARVRPPRRAAARRGAPLPCRRACRRMDRRQALQGRAEHMAQAHFRAVSALWRGEVPSVTDWLFPALCGLFDGNPLVLGRRRRDTASFMHDALFRRGAAHSAGHQPALFSANRGHLALRASQKRISQQSRPARGHPDRHALCARRRVFDDQWSTAASSASRSGCSCSTRGCRSSLKRRKTAKKKRRDFRHGVFDSIQMRSAVSSAI